MLTIPFSYPGEMYDGDEFSVLCPAKGEVVAFSIGFHSHSSRQPMVMRLQDISGESPNAFIEVEIPWIFSFSGSDASNAAAGSIKVEKNAVLVVRAVAVIEVLFGPFPPGDETQGNPHYASGFFQVKEE